MVYLIVKYVLATSNYEILNGVPTLKHATLKHATLKHVTLKHRSDKHTDT